MPAITLPCQRPRSLGDQGCAVAQGSTQLTQANDGISGVGLTHLRNEILTFLEHGHNTFPQSAFEKSLTVFGNHLLLLSQRHTRHADNDGLGCGSQGVHQFLHVDGLGGRVAGRRRWATAQPDNREHREHRNRRTEVRVVRILP